MVTAALRQRRRLWLASLAIALSVGYLAGALTLLNRVSEGLTNLSAAGFENADLVIEGDVAYESTLEQTRRLISSSIALSLIGQPGIASVTPRIEDIAVILADDGGSIVTPGLTEQPIGTNWPDDEATSPYEFVGKGRPPVGPDEVVIDERSAREGGVEVGDAVTVVTRNEVGRFKVVGLVNTERGLLPAGSSLTLFETDRARQLFAMEDVDTRVGVTVVDGADVEEVRAGIERSLPYGAVVVSGEEAAAHRQESINRSFTLVRSLIMGFAGLALLVGMVTAANSLTLLYSQRRLTFATFRLVGAKRHQIMGAALVEAAMLALIASLAGAPVGMILGALIEAVLGSLGTPVPVAGSRFSLSALVIAVVVGALATVLAAVVPAWRACSTPAIQAIVPVEAAPRRNFRARLTRMAAIALSAGLIGWALSVITDLGAGYRLQVFVGLVLGVLVLSAVPAVLSYAVAGGIVAFPEKSAALRRIGARDALRNRTRTAATTAALLLATAVVCGIAVFLNSFSAVLGSDVADLVTADLVVDSGTFTVGGLPRGLLDDISGLDGVDAVSGWQLGRVDINGLPARVTGMDSVAIDSVLSPNWVGEAPTPFGFDGVALSQKMADQLGVGLGDVVAVRFTSEQTAMMTVRGIFSRGDVLLGAAIVERALLTAQIPKSNDLAGLVSIDGDEKAVTNEIESLAADYGVESVVAPDDFVNSRSQLLHGFERVIQWMLFFTLIQALVGVVNTLLLSVGERRREFGLLRAAGATRQQLMRMVLIEGGSFAVVGTILGVLVGTAGAWAAMRSLAGFGLTGFAVPFVLVVVIAVAAGSLGVLAAVVPARWASAVPPLEAVVDTADDVVRPDLVELVRSVGTRFRSLIGGRRRIPTPATAQRTDIGVGAGMAGGMRSAQTVGPVPGSVAGADGRSSIPGVTPSGAVRFGTPMEPVGQTTASPPPPPPARHSVFSERSRWDARADRATSIPKIPDSLAAVTARMDRISIADSGPLLDLLNDRLDYAEVVQNLIQGWVKGLPCLVARTDSRMMILVSKFPEPMIQSLRMDQVSVSTYGPANAATTSVHIVHGKRMMEIIGVRDRSEVVAMIEATSTDPSDKDGYF